MPSPNGPSAETQKEKTILASTPVADSAEKHHVTTVQTRDQKKDDSTLNIEMSAQNTASPVMSSQEQVPAVHSKSEPEPELQPPHSVLSEPVKITIILTASFAGLISPLSASIYYPALNSLARDLHVSLSAITLTITTYMIFQGLAPSFIASYSDLHGRRPAYLICFIVYIAANIGLAVQNSYAALMVLRCLQSTGSSGTIALAIAIVSDVSTRAERGKYVGYASLGLTLGPALGPVIGGLIDENLGWRWIFWVLVIFASVFFCVIVVTLPETSRAVVGNGSIPAAPWNRSVLQYVQQRGKKLDTASVDAETTKKKQKQNKWKSLNPLASLRIATEKEAGLILWYGALLYCGYLAVLSTLSTQLNTRYGFDALTIGLCYLPIGFGSLTSRWTVGFMLDRNFHRVARLHNIPIIKNRQQNIAKFPIETARLQICLPLLFMACLAIVAYSWVMEYKTSLAGPLVMLFFVGHFTAGAFTTLTTLVVDVHKDTPATAVAANNLFRCLLGAGATALANPLIERIGIGWTGTFVAFLWVLFSPCLYAVSRYGMGWRAEALARAEEKENEKTRKAEEKDLEAGGK